MQFLRHLFDFYIRSSLHVGFAVMALVYITVFSHDLKENSVYAGCVFFGTVVSYNFLKYVGLFKEKNFMLKEYSGILIVTVFAGIAFSIFFMNLNQSFQIHILISGLFVLIYPFLRKHGWLKLFLVSFVVTYVTVYIPYLNINYLPLDFYVNLMQRFFILTSLLIPFEIMDSKTDAETMNTLPQLLGISLTKIFGITLVIPFMVLEFLKHEASYIILPVGIITVLFINFTTLERNKYYTSFWVESVPIFWLILLVAA
jgi:hypothetical protein